MNTHCEWQDCPIPVEAIFQYDPGECVLSLCLTHAYRLINVYPDGVMRVLAYSLP